MLGELERKGWLTLQRASLPILLLIADNNTPLQVQHWMKQTPQHEPSVVVMYMQPTTGQVVWEGKLGDVKLLSNIQMTNMFFIMTGPEHMKTFVTNVADKFKEVALHGRSLLDNVER